MFGATIFLGVYHSRISSFQHLCGISVQWVAVYLSWYVGACHFAASCWVRKQQLYPKTGSGYCWCWGESGRLYKYYQFLWMIITPMIYSLVCIQKRINKYHSFWWYGCAADGSSGDGRDSDWVLGLTADPGCAQPWCGICVNLTPFIFFIKRENIQELMFSNLKLHGLSKFFVQIFFILLWSLIQNLTLILTLATIYLTLTSTKCQFIPVNLILHPKI